MDSEPSPQSERTAGPDLTRDFVVVLFQTQDL
jgi:hypothetical protein